MFRATFKSLLAPRSSGWCSRRSSDRARRRVRRGHVRADRHDEQGVRRAVRSTSTGAPTSSCGRPSRSRHGRPAPAAGAAVTTESRSPESVLDDVRGVAGRGDRGRRRERLRPDGRSGDGRGDRRGRAADDRHELERARPTDPVACAEGSGRRPGPDEVRDRRRDRRGSTGCAVGDDIQILFQGPPQEFTIVGHRGLRRGRQPRRRDARGVRHRRPRREVLGKRGRLRCDPASSADEGVAAPELRASVAAVLPEGARGRHVEPPSPTSSRRSLQGGAGLLPDGVARVRGRRAVRGRVHHLQHVLDHRGAAHAGARRCCARSGRAGGRS